MSTGARSIHGTRANDFSARRLLGRLTPLAVVLLTSACAGSGRSATQVVQDYYRCVAHHNVREAAQLLTSNLSSLEKSAPDSDFNNIERISNVRITQPYNIRLDDQYKDEVQVVATYSARFRHVVTAQSGSQTRFIYLGRNDSSQPWLIIAIGSGP